MKKILYLFILSILVNKNIFSQENNNKEVEVQKNTTEKEKIFSLGLYSSVDSIKTSVNIEFGFPIVQFSKFEIKSFTSIVGYKMFDSNNPDLYMLGISQKITFGSKRKNIDGIEITRYSFAFFSIGALSFKSDGTPKYLFSKPLFYEVGGGAGFHIFIDRHVSIVLEFGGGINRTINDDSYSRNIVSGAFGRISAGARYYF